MGERLRGRRGRPCVRKRGGEGLPRRPVVQPGSDGLRVKPGIRSRTGRDLKHRTGTIQSHQSNETEKDGQKTIPEKLGGDIGSFERRFKGAAILREGRGAGLSPRPSWRSVMAFRSELGRVETGRPRSFDQGALASGHVPNGAGGGGLQRSARALKNPYYLGDEPALTQTSGWADA